MASAPREVWGDLATSAFVESSLLFRSLDPEARRDVVQIAQVIAYEPGETISSGEDDSFLLLLEGKAAVLVDGTEVAQLERGATFGEGRVLGHGRHPALVARTDVQVVAFPAPILSAIAARFPKVHKLLEAVLAARERDTAPRA
ncbi:MAG: cyclic nucleotide-binding domain-containing protein [Anaeromyxobacter sp.]